MSKQNSVWTKDKIDRLRKLIRQGLSFSQIGERLGATRCAVAGCCYRIGLKRKIK